LSFYPRSVTSIRHDGSLTYTLKRKRNSFSAPKIGLAEARTSAASFGIEKYKAAITPRWLTHSARRAGNWISIKSSVLRPS